MLGDKSKQTLRSLCPEVRGEILEDFLARLDDDYFAIFPIEVIAEHIRLSSRIDAEHRALAHVTPQGTNEYDILIVGYDYPSAFSLVCGLLSAFGLDIRTGDIYSFSRQAGKSSAGKIVDLFRVVLREAESFDEVRQREFQQELHVLADFLASGDFNEARERLNRFLIERIEKMGDAFAGLESRLDIRIDNQTSPDWTLMEIRAEDTFGLLYAVSNAMAMRGIYIHSVKIRSSNGMATDHFLIANRWGRKIEKDQDQRRLKMAVSMIKQFTRFLPEAPDPAKALSHFDQFLDKLIEISDDRFPDRAIEFLAGNEGMNMLAHLLGSSDFLWDDLLRVRFSELLPALEDFAKWQLQPGPAFKASLRREVREALDSASGLEEQKKALNAFKDRYVFLIDAAHLVQPQATLLNFSYALTDLGEIVIEEAARICHDHLAHKSAQSSQSDRSEFAFSVFGLGKFGGREMGYASDIELLFVHQNGARGSFFEALSRLIVDSIEARSHGIFQIDLRLRPFGEAGTWSVSLEQFLKYYSPEGDAAPFERQALIKLRWIAGDEELGRRVVAHRDRYTYSGLSWDWADAMQLRRRQMLELVRQGQVNVKYSAGGIIDVEYAVQYLQLLNGAEHREIRLSNTLDALQGLRSLQIIREADYATLHDGYIFLRKLIDSLRIVRGDATDLVLPEETSDEFKSLARRLGYRERDRTKGAARLLADTRETMKKIHDYFTLRFHFAE